MFSFPITGALVPVFPSPIDGAALSGSQAPVPAAVEDTDGTGLADLAAVGSGGRDGTDTSPGAGCAHGWTHEVPGSPDTWKCVSCRMVFPPGFRPDGHPTSAYGVEQARRAQEQAMGWQPSVVPPQESLLRARLDRALAERAEISARADLLAGQVMDLRGQLVATTDGAETDADALRRLAGQLAEQRADHAALLEQALTLVQRCEQRPWWHPPFTAEELPTLRYLLADAQLRLAVDAL